MRNIKLFLILVLVISFVNAQSDFKQVVPPNPNVASLFKSTITPVSEYSGSASINIPVYTMSEGMINIPLSIGYATGGIQVGEEASVVGLGWALNTGGAITRTIYGIDDFDSKGILNNSKQIPAIPVNINNTTEMAEFWNSNPFLESQDAQGSQTNANCTFISAGVTGFYDLPPRSSYFKDNDFMHDTFMYNYNGGSGSFILNKNTTEAFLLNKKPVKIWYEGIGTGSSSNIKFKILAEDGTEYTFSQRGITYFDNGNLDDFVSTWYLKEITDIYNNQAIFNYNTDNDYYPFRSFNQAFFATQGTSSGSSSYYKEMVGPLTRVDDILLSSIVIKKNNVTVQEAVFTYSNAPVNGYGGERLDLDSSFLKKIEIFNNEDPNPIQQFSFHHSYFGYDQNYSTQNISLAAGDFGSTINANDGIYPHINLRLKLDSIVANNIETYKFKYHLGNNLIPNKTSMSQDYWGFYNGVTNQDVFIPELSSLQEGQAYVPQQKTANRLPNENLAKLFSIKSVEYPTRGTTEYDYELNTFDQTYNAIPTPTTTKPYFASSPGPGDVKIITPNQNQTLTVSFNVTITGWNVEKQVNRPAQPTYSNNFFVQLEKLDGTIVAKMTLDSYSPDYQWDDLQNNYQSNGILNEQQVFDFSYDPNTPSHLRLTENQYVLRAVFNDFDGLYYGQAHISTNIEELEVSETEKYSVGGGLRISKITNKNTDGTIITENVFNYHYKELDANNVEVTKSYGRLKTAPNYSLDKKTVYNLSFWLSDNSIYGAMPLMIGAAGSQTPWSRDMGNFVGYDKVESYQVSELVPNGKVVKTFVNQADTFRTGRAGLIYKDDYYKFPPIRVPHNGLLLEEEVYNVQGDLIKYVENEYSVNGTNGRFYDLGRQLWQQDFVLSASKELPFDNVSSGGSIYYYCDAMKFQFYPHYSNLIQQTGTSQTIYDKDGNNPITTIQEFKYDNTDHYQKTETKLTNSKGEEVVTKIFYPDDVTTTSSLGEPFLSAPDKQLIDRLKKDGALHRIAEPIQTETTVNGVKTIQRTYYKDWTGSTDPLSTVVWPEYVTTLKGDFDDSQSATKNAMETRLKYLEYDNFGNPLNVSKENGTKIAYVWGYSNKYPVAKIENATYQNVLNTGVNLSIINNSASTESQIITELNKIRDNLPNAMVTTYTYKPLVGVKTVTDPRGYSMNYYYDTQNRLKEVRDKDDNLLTDYEYHYKGQTSN